MTIAEEIAADSEAGAKRIEAEYKTRLCAIAKNLGLDWAEAEALVYNTIDEAVKSIGRYDERSQFFSWMAKIMVNLHGKATRRKEHERVVFTDALPDVAEGETVAGAASAIAGATSAPLPGNGGPEVLDAEFLRSAIESLPPDMRESVVLHYFMDVPLARMAKLLAVPVGTVKSRLHYARLALAKRLGVRKIVLAAAVFVLATMGAWEVAKTIPRILVWRPGRTMAKFEDAANWAQVGPGGGGAGGLPVAGAGNGDRIAAAPTFLPDADTVLSGAGDYAFDASGALDHTIRGWQTPGDWDNHYLVLANGALKFRGDVATHTGELTIEDGGELTFLEGSTYTPAIFSAGKWTTRVKAGGTFKLFGSFKGYSYRIIVEEGGKATLNPQYWGGAGASEQADNAIENRGELNLPAGLVWRKGGGSAERYSVFIRQLDGTLSIAGPVAKAEGVRNFMRLGVELAGGRVAVAGNVSFAVDEARISGGVTFEIARGATIDLSPFAVAPGATISVAGEGTIVLPDGVECTLLGDGSAVPVIRHASDAVAGCDVVLRGGEVLTVTNFTTLAGGIATFPGADGELPVVRIAEGGTLSVPGGTKFGNVRLVVEGVLCAHSPGDLVLGWAPAGGRAAFALKVAGGEILNPSGNIDFFAPGFDGAVAAAGECVLEDATLRTGPRHAFNFGKGNPEAEAVRIVLSGTSLDYGGGIYYAAGGVVLDFREGARLFRPDNAGEVAELIVKDRAALRFGPGSSLEYGASANSFGSVGNGGISFMPSEEGYPALVIDGATFWYHHPNSIRGAHKASVCATNATYVLKTVDWNYTLPFSGFSRTDVAGGLDVRTGETTAIDPARLQAIKSAIVR